MPGEPRTGRSAQALLLIVLSLGIALTSGCATLVDASKKLLGQNRDNEESASNSPPPTVEITISGVEQAVRTNIGAHLSLSSETCDAPEWRVVRLAEKGEGEVREALRALGFYEPQAINVVLGESETCWTASVDVAPGEAVLIASVEARLEGDGADAVGFVAHLESLPVRVGERLSHSDYESAKRAIANYAIEHGFLDGRFITSRLSVDVSNHTAHVEFVYAPGDRYRLGKLTIEQQHLEQDLVERLAAYEEGEPYETSEIIELNRRLSESGYFGQVDVKPRLERPEDGAIPVDVTLTPRKKHAFTAGAGITTDGGPRLRLGYDNRWFNPAGHRWSMHSTVSLIEQSLDGEYRIPLADPRKEWLSFQAGLQREDTDTSQTNAAKLGLAKTRQRGNWLETFFLSLTYDDFKVGRQKGTALLLTPGISYATSRSDNRLRTTDGYRLFAEIRGGHENVGSDVSFLRAFGSAGWVHGLPGEDDC